MRMGERISKRVRRQVAERAQGCCEYCCSQQAYATEDFSIEHILPQQSGGLSTLNNLALSCQGCNSHKYAKISGIDPVNNVEIALFHPRQQSWNDHFTWNEDATLMVGISLAGRATVETLKLNRPGVVNLRRLLHAVNQHPPKHTIH